MRILIIANAWQQEEIKLKTKNQDVALRVRNELPGVSQYSSFNAFFYSFPER